MAGIGFVLQKLVRREGLSGLFRAVVAGAVIVAGPWLVSTAGVGLVSTVAAGSIPDDPELFGFAIIICYTASLAAFGGFHYVFSRSVADCVYMKKRADAAMVLVAASLLVGVLAAGLGGLVAALASPPTLVDRGLWAAGLVALFAAVNVGWLLMLFSSLIKRYVLLIAVYALGMGASVALALLLAPEHGAGGAVAGFAGGQVLLCLILSAICFRAYAPRGGSLAAAFRSLRAYAGLLVAGTAFVWAFWADKVVYWFCFGAPVEGTVFMLYGPYDLAVFTANLSTVPGLVYFVIATETGFFRELRRFIKSVEGDVYRNIQINKYRLALRAREGLGEQTIFQVAVSAALILLVADPLLQVTLAGTCAYLFLLTVVVYLLYLQAFFEVLLSALVFLAVNAGCALAAGLLGATWAVGWGFLLAALLASVLAYYLFRGLVRRYDRILFVRSTLRMPQLSPLMRAVARRARS